MKGLDGNQGGGGGIQRYAVYHHSPLRLQSANGNEKRRIRQRNEKRVKREVSERKRKRKKKKVKEERSYSNLPRVHNDGASKFNDKGISEGENQGIGTRQRSQESTRPNSRKSGEREEIHLMFKVKIF